MGQIATMLAERSFAHVVSAFRRREFVSGQQMTWAPEVIPHSRQKLCPWAWVCGRSVTSDLESAYNQVTIWDHHQWPTWDFWTHLWMRIQFIINEQKRNAVCNKSLHPHSKWTIWGMNVRAGGKHIKDKKTIRFLQMQVKLYFGLRGMFVQHFCSWK